MELPLEYVQIVQDIVLTPNIESAFSLFWFSIFNELTSLFPLGVILTAQIAFLEGSMNLLVFTRLFFLVSIPLSVGTAIGSLLFYGLAYFGGKPVIDRYGKYVRFSWQRVEKIVSYFRGGWYDEMLFLILRIIPFFPGVPLTIAAGVVRMRPMPFFVLTAIGTIVRVMIMFIMVDFGINLF